MLFKYDGLKIAQYAFLVIAVLAAFTIFGLSGMSYETALENPLLTAQLLLIFSYPFCYLLLKQIRIRMDEDCEAQRLSLLFFLLIQAISMNLVIIFLIAYGLWNSYGKELNIKTLFRTSKCDLKMLLSMIPLLLVNVLVLFIRIRARAIGI